MILRKASRLITSSSRRYFAVSIKNDVIIETNELEQLIKEEPDNLSILNASLLRADYDPRADHIKERIKGSIFFDF